MQNSVDTHERTPLFLMKSNVQLLHDIQFCCCCCCCIQLIINITALLICPFVSLNIIIPLLACDHRPNTNNVIMKTYLITIRNADTVACAIFHLHFPRIQQTCNKSWNCIMSIRLFEYVWQAHGMSVVSVCQKWMSNASNNRTKNEGKIECKW